MSDRTTTVLYTHGGGRFGNQMLRFMHWIAWVEEHAGRFVVVDLPFWPFAEHFSTWSHRPLCAYPIKRRMADTLVGGWNRFPDWMRRRVEFRGQRFLSRVAAAFSGKMVGSISVAAHEKVDLSAAAFAARVGQASICVVDGWGLSCWDWVRKHEDVVRHAFRPTESAASIVSPFIRRERGQCGLLIGLLIRRTDYQSWDGGRYFFPISTYVRWIEELLDIYADSRPRILIASDEPLDVEAFKSLPVSFATGQACGAGHWIENFLELAACDIVVSPPSTFAGCAAFLGGTALIPLRHHGQALSRGDAMLDHLFGAANDADFSRAVK